MKKDKVVVVGLGFVGLTFAAKVAKYRTVYGLEINPATKELIKSGEAHFYEEGLNEEIKDSVNKSLHITDIGDVPWDEVGIVVVSIGTPLVDGKTCMSPVLTLSETLASYVKGETIIAMRSTLSVGTTRLLNQNLISKGFNNIRFAFCPERTIEGNALQELSSLPQIIGCLDEVTETLLLDFFRLFTEEQYVCTFEEAELAKLYCNTLRDLQFNLANLLWLVSHEHNIDHDKVLKIAGRNYNRFDPKRYGLVGGPCLEKDAIILSSTLNDPGLKSLIIGLRHLSNRMEIALIEKITDKYGKDPRIKIGVLGIAFKGFPETDDLRGSNGLSLVKTIRGELSRSTVYQFDVVLEGKNNNISPIELLNDMDVIIIANNHPKNPQTVKSVRALVLNAFEF